MKTILIAILAGLSVALAGVLGYQKLIQPEITPIVINQPAINQLANNQPQENKQCITEGAWSFYFLEDEDLENKAMCCSGLTPLSYHDYLGADGVCYLRGGDTRILCTKCGNGVCGLGESKCNCPQDCK